MDQDIKECLVTLFKDSSKILYTTAEAAEALGMSSAALCNLIKSGNGPKFICAGGRYRSFKKTDLIAFVDKLPTYKSMDEYFEAHPEHRPKDEYLIKIEKGAIPLTCRRLGSQG